jgi:hypothetical protein
LHLLAIGPRKCGCCVNWVDEPPVDLDSHKKSRAEHGDYALVVRKTGHGGDDTWKIKSITVFSPYILELFRKVLKDYPGVATALDRVELDAPFEPLLHRWEALDEGLKEDNDLKARNHFNLFRQVVEPVLEPHLKAAAECKEHGVIPYESVWTIFPPGSLVTWEGDGQSNIGRMEEAGNAWSLSGPVYQVTCDQVDWNGEVFGFTKKTIKIQSFEGTRPVTELSIIPLDLKPNATELKKAHIQRGRAFEALHGYHFKAYEGPAQGTDRWGLRKTQKRINDRVVIDMFSYYHFEQMQPPALSSLDGVVDLSVERIPRYDHGWEQPIDIEYDPGFIEEHDYSRGPRRPRNRDRSHRRPLRRAADDGDEDVKLKPLTEDQLLLTVPWVKGFVLKEKKWYSLAVNHIKPIIWNDSFSNLVLPHQEKDLLLAFAQSKIKSSDIYFDDFVDGKGRGIIILLSGSPGVGKTLTAESIAEKMQVPLYTLSAGEIGIMPTTVESEISSALEKCTMWNAILLLDEADVFLEKRELNSWKRNELVSIFLRLLEYYEGMMFLTTNRVSTIDPAFESRIDVSIDYPNLTPELRLQIWENFLYRDEEVKAAMGKDELAPIAKLSLNGRQIKSAVKTAQLLAMSKEEGLKIEHLRKVLRLHRLEA